MRFLQNPPRHLLFTGKGGVGKTSVACATAVRLAQGGRRVLLVSTDPASNVGQVFETSIGHRITSIERIPGLSALEIDPDAAAEAYRERILAPVRSLLPAKEIAAITEQLSGSCTTEVASFNEFTSLLADPSVTSEFDHVIFDTAPTGHTLRLLKLPGEWTSFLDDGKGDASCLGPMSGLEKSRSAYRAAIHALTDQGTTRLVLVARAQRSSLREAARTRDELAALGIHATYLVLNAVLPPARPADVDDELYAATLAREQAALAILETEFAGLMTDRIPLRAMNMVGVAALTDLLEGADATAESGVEPPALPEPPESETLAALLDELSAQGHGLIMAMGKGGVGKTTIASALAVGLARRGHPVRLTTTDPAAHVAMTLHGEVAGLVVDAIDPDRAIQDYRDHVMATRGGGLDEAGREALREDLMSPCTEEIAVFQQFSEAVSVASQQFVVMDTAPTGHTLLLMDATGAYHREVTRHMTEAERATATTPLRMLQDPDHTKVVVVTLPETTPVAEANQLVDDLARARITPWAWVVNNSLLAARPMAPLLRVRAQGEQPLINKVRDLAERLAVVPAQVVEPVGVEALSRLDT